MKKQPATRTVPVELSEAELDKVAGGVSPFENPGGHKPPGQTPNPNPGK